MEGGSGGGSAGGGGVGEWRGDDFAGGGQLEGKVHHCLATTQGLKVENCWTPLPPEVDSMAELVLDEVVGCCSPRAYRPGLSWSRRGLVVGEG